MKRKDFIASIRGRNREIRCSPDPMERGINMQNCWLALFTGHPEHGGRELSNKPTIKTYKTNGYRRAQLRSVNMAGIQLYKPDNLRFEDVELPVAIERWEEVTHLGLCLSPTGLPISIVGWTGNTGTITYRAVPGVKYTLKQLIFPIDWRRFLKS